MADLPQTPSTEAQVDNFTPTTTHGRALLDWPQNFGYHHPDCEVTAEDDCTCDLADRILAIEAEARATTEGQLIDLARLIVSYADATHEAFTGKAEIGLNQIADEWRKVVDKARLIVAAHE